MNIKIRILVTLTSLLLITAAILPAVAQSGVSSIQGTIKDSTGAVMPGASIHVVNIATGIATNTKSNRVGFYQVPGLFTGTYSLAVTVPGMKTYKTSIELLVAQNAVINPVLSPGQVTQQVTVNADSIQLTTPDSGTISSTLENERIQSLPMDGRNITTLVGETTPGMEDGGQKMDGQAVEALEYVVDGSSTENTAFGGQDGVYGGAGSGPSRQLLDPDAIQQAKVQAANAGAQYATPATVLLTTKSGTNQIHGTFFETARNNAFGIARSIQDPVNYSAPHLVRNEFGLSAGGPIVLPHLYNGKDRSFWFFAYERYSLAQSSASLTAVPTQAMLNGDYSGLITSAGILQVLYDPSTTHADSACPVPRSTTTENNPYCRTPFPNNTIPSGEISPLAKIYAQLIPVPTSPADPLVQPNLTALTPTYQLLPQITFRLDHKFDEKNSAYLRYTQILGSLDATGGPRNLAVNSNGVNIPVGAAFGYSNAPETSFLSSVNYTHIFSSTFFSETIAAQQWLNDQQVPGAGINNDYESMLGLPNNFGETGFPSVTGMITDLGTSQTNNAKIDQIVSTFDENLTKIVGRNQMHFGGRFRHTRAAIKPNGSADTIAFGGSPTGLYEPSSGNDYDLYSYTGSNNGSFFLGAANTYSVWLQPPHVHYRVQEVDGYFQDDYHLSENLTVNLGLRWEAHPAIYTQDNLQTSFDLKNDAQVLGNTPANLISKGYTTQAIIANDQAIGIKFENAQEAGMPSKLMKDYDFNFLPRVGFAYLPFSGRWGTVIRGAYGRFDYPTPLEDYADHDEASNPYVANYTRSYTSASQAVDGLPNEQERYNGPVAFGVAGKNTANVVDSNSATAILPGATAPFEVAPNWEPTFVSESNLTIEQPFKGHSVLRVSYIYNHASNLDTILYPNNHPSTYQWEMATGTVPPTGGASVIGTGAQDTYSATATGPYDQTTWGSFSWHTRSGWSNYNALQLNYQRLFHHGYAYQFTYVYDKAMRMGGDQPDGLEGVDPVANYPGVLGTASTMTSPNGPFYPGVAPPARPAGNPVWADYHALNKFEQYQLDSDQPTMHIRFNWLVDLPFGRGKRFFGNANRFVNEIIGGFQLAGDGNIFSTVFQPNTAGNWGQISPLKIYKHKVPITDCRSGVCDKAYMWFNGYLAPTVTTGIPGSTCTTNCVTGLPANYQPVQAPIDNTPGTTDYGTNDVQISSPALLASNKGQPVTIAYDAGPQASNYLAKTWIHGPINWPMDASLFKVFPITGRVNLRVDVDAFNVFNMPGENNPGSDGVQDFLTSHNSPRELQITARLTF